jgi:hypothetical protein
MFRHRPSPRQLWQRKTDQVQYNRQLPSGLCFPPRQFCGRDPRFATITDKEFAPSVRAILHECKRHEDMPHRVDPYTVQMHDNLMAHNDCRQAHQDGASRALEDWSNIGSYLGFRLREYAQEDSFRHFASGGEQADNGTKRAITLSDIRFEDSSGHPVSVADFCQNPQSVTKIYATFSWQKNMQHGETKLLLTNHNLPHRDAIMSMHKVICRFARLVGLDKTDIPLAVYKEGNQLFFLHGKLITTHLRRLAKRTYRLSERDLQKHYRYSSHSLRAGAAVLLHASGSGPSQIKFLLRWRSDSFMLYLRNVAHLSDHQNQAFLQMADATAQAATRATSNLRTTT